MSRLSLFCLVLVLAITSTMAQPSDNDTSPPVLDVNGQPLQRDLEYLILPENNASGLTLINRNNSCPLYVGQEDSSVTQGLPLVFTPFQAEETLIRESHDFTVAFLASTICAQSTAWRVGEEDPETGRRLIVTGGEAGFFRIDRNGTEYNLAWCPSEACPNCRPRCGIAGILIENEKRLLALDGPTVPVVFRRAGTA
ncbi:kunitz type trypsin inhibitor 104-like [Mangifera indica]|uniref:kunitz type trypsin inhibitor 104-like n=1 Tax=Mangifera indica TaxID=29780 RepID=UPI001CFB89B1|nr:kunitz type trypsin inhibitor 104-like [Mangifera indica]